MEYFAEYIKIVNYLTSKIFRLLTVIVMKMLNFENN